MRAITLSRRGGFTLVELLVVIGIIAILIGILMPVLSAARKASYRTVCLSNIRQLGVGVIMYCQENDGWFPTCAYADMPPAYKYYPDDWIHWQANRDLNNSAIAKYLGRGEKLKDLLRCPADTFEGRKAAIAITPGQGPHPYSYAMNDALAANTKNPPQLRRTKLSRWRAPSKKILLTEIFEKYNVCPAWNYGVELAWRHGTATSRGNAIIGSSGSKMGNNVSAVFLDGHAEGTNDDIACNISQIQPRAQ